MSNNNTEPYWKETLLSEHKEVWLRAWIASKQYGTYNDGCRYNANACLQHYIETFEKK